MLLWVGNFGSVVLLAQWLSAKVYEANITDGSTVCMGDACFGFTFMVVAALNASGMLSAGILVVRQACLTRAAAASARLQ